MDDHHNLVVRLSRERKLVMFGLSHYKALGTSIHLLLSCNKWFAFDGKVIAVADSFPELWVKIEDCFEKK